MNVPRTRITRRTPDTPVGRARSAVACHRWRESRQPRAAGAGTSSTLCAPPPLALFCECDSAAAAPRRVRGRAPRGLADGQQLACRRCFYAISPAAPRGQCQFPLCRCWVAARGRKGGGSGQTRRLRRVMVTKLPQRPIVFARREFWFPRPTRRARCRPAKFSDTKKAAGPVDAPRRCHQSARRPPHQKLKAQRTIWAARCC